MSKELKALERIVDTYYIDNMDKEISIIETALKEYELMKEIRITARFDLAQVNKEHKALEIFKEKNVDIRGIKETKNVHEYNVEFPTTLKEFLEEQEYDLLKEVLL